MLNMRMMPIFFFNLILSLYSCVNGSASIQMSRDMLKPTWLSTSLLKSRQAPACRPSQPSQYSGSGSHWVKVRMRYKTAMSRLSPWVTHTTLRKRTDGKMRR